jgi:hypothetical protein
MYIFLLLSLLLVLANIFFPVCKIHLNSKYTTRLQRVWKIWFSALLILLFFSFFDIYIRGYWTTKIIILGFVVVSGIFYAFADRAASNGMLRKLSLCISVIPFLITLFYLILGSGNGFIAHVFITTFGGSNSAILYSDDEVRVERDNRGIRNPRSPRYFRKYELFEIDKGSIVCTQNPDSVDVSHHGDSITFYCFDKSYESSGMANPHISTASR